MKIIDGWLDIAERAETENHGGKLLEHRWIRLHDTTGFVGPSIAHLQKPETRASYHLIIGRDGKVYQMVSLALVSWDAGIGEREFQDLQYPNNRGFGIAFENLGEVYVNDEGWHIAEKPWFGATVISLENIDWKSKRAWHSYTKEQLVVGSAIIRLLATEYGISELWRHADINPRKSDTNPTFPLETMRGIL
jgi:N-acetylmuramoyl-L-alanine amidase